MKQAGMVLAVLVALAGVIFIAQGTGLLPVGGMANQIVWAYIGGVMIVAAVGWLIYTGRSRAK